MAASKSSTLVAITGNPNCGKSTLFNALTGLRAKVGNYAGVTVERKEGSLKGAPADAGITLLDLPGTYSLSPRSLDEQIARDALLHHLGDVPAPDLIVVVVDASNLERNLYYATQVIELGHPVLIALNMMDVAREHGHEVDPAALARELGVPVLPLVASRGDGLPALREAILATIAAPPENRTPHFGQLPAAFERELAALTALLHDAGSSPDSARRSVRAEGLLALADEKFLADNASFYPVGLPGNVAAARARIEAAGVDWRSAAIEARYARIAAIARATITETDLGADTLSDRLDRIFTHKVWGLVLFVAIMALMFQGIFTFAKWPMDFLTGVLDAIGGWTAGQMPPGDLNDLLVNGMIKGVGAVVIFLPQICLLFLFIGLLEDTGYMSRAAFLMDRLMSRVGLHGKSFIPMLSSFACAIPGIMATRTIENPKDRLATLLVAPLMSCSARLPVYTVLIAACIPQTKLLGLFGLPGLTMLAMYLLGIVAALLMAWLFKKTLLRSQTPMLIMELPPYKRPVLTVTLRHMWDRAGLFLKRAGTIILGISILLWFLATYPKNDSIEKSFAAQRAAMSVPKTEGLTPEMAKAAEEDHSRKLAELDQREAGAKLGHSFVGRIGRFIEPAIEPLGFDWKIGIGIVASFAAREVFVSTMSVIYNVGDYDKSEAAVTSLAKVLREQQRSDGTPLYTPLLAISLMIFYVFALQCVSTVAVMRRETAGWKWPLFQWLYMGALAWGLAFLTYQGGRLLGWQ
jgi:ferrous iron transport protein B